MHEISCVGGQSIIIADDVIDHLMRYRQNTIWRKEAGGQLFAQLSRFEVFICAATGPRKTDIRRRCAYIPDRKAEQREIDDHFSQGLIYVGDWHTHPEAHPSPSWRDEKSIVECFAKSHHALQGFLFLIVGSSNNWNDVYIGLCNENSIYPLNIRRFK